MLAGVCVDSRESMPAGPGNSLDYQDDGTFNAFETRVSKTVSGTTTSYRRGGAGVTDPVLSETTGGTTTAYMPGTSEKRGSNPTQYLHSGIKNADARTSGQTVDATRQYDAFGNLTSSSGTWQGPFGYAGGFGYQEDAESGLKLLGHRYYDSTTGRFLSKDPASSGRNWYAYCVRNPISQADPSGYLTIAGDTSGWARFAWLAPGNWPSHNGPSKKEAMRMLIETNDDSVGIWGHGDTGRIYVNDKEYLTAEDIHNIAIERKKRNKPKFKSFEVNECYVFADPKMVNSVLELSDEATGYTEWNNHSPRRTWRKPLDPNGETPTPDGKKRRRPGMPKSVDSDQRTGSH